MKLGAWSNISASRLRLSRSLGSADEAGMSCRTLRTANLSLKALYFENLSALKTSAFNDLGSFPRAIVDVVATGDGLLGREGHVPRRPRIGSMCRSSGTLDHTAVEPWIVRMQVVLALYLRARGTMFCRGAAKPCGHSDVRGFRRPLQVGGGNA